jgi:hypothetical protein
MTTAWVRGTLDWAAAASEGDHIHYVVDRLGHFLAEAASLDPAVIEASDTCPSPTRSAES